MITRQIQNPTDSPLRFQRTDDGFFNATMLLNEFNQNVKYGEHREMNGFLRIKSTKEYSDFIEETYGVKAYKMTRGQKGGTWMHPHLFIDFAMWISVEFKDMAIKWILDGLMKERNDAGDYANLLKATIVVRLMEWNGCKPSPMVYQNEFTMLRQLAGITDRNTANEKQLKVLNTLQQLDIKLINDKVGKASRQKQLKQLAEALS